MALLPYDYRRGWQATNEMKMDDGSVSVGSYDLVPLLDDFIKEHPDFSYRGAKACIAFTGYNGILATAPIPLQY